MAGVRPPRRLAGRQRPTAGCLLDVYAEHIGGLTIGPDAKRIRRRAAERLLALYPDLAAWTARHPDDVARLVEVAARLDWSALWTRDMTSGGLALLCLWAGTTLDQLRDDDFAQI